jgi:hypothetical protein
MLAVPKTPRNNNKKKTRVLIFCQSKLWGNRNSKKKKAPGSLTPLDKKKHPFRNLVLKTLLSFSKVGTAS